MRSSWLFGPTGHNFVRTMLRLAAERDEVAVVDDQRGSPTYVGHLAAATRQVVHLPYGVYHVAAEGEATWADFAEAIFEEAGLDTRVRRIATAELDPPRQAPRPAYSVLRSEKGAPDAAALARRPPRVPRGDRVAGMASYSFLTTWILDAPRDDVWKAIYEIERWPEWWRGVRSVERLEEGDADGIGALYRHEWRSVIPYPVRFETRITRIEPPRPDRGRRGRRAGRDRPLALLRRPRDAVTYEWNVRTTQAVDEPRRAARAADLPLEPQRRHAPGRRRTRCSAGRAAARRHVAFSAMRVLVTGGAGFIGSHFAKRLLAAGDDVRVLDKLTYSGNPANLEGTGIELVVGDICDPDAVAEAAAGCDAIVNFAAETHVDRSILGATDFGRTEFFGTQVLLEEVRRTRRALRPGLDGRGLRRPRAAAAPRSRPIRSSRPARTASRRPPATSTSPRTRGRSASTPRSPAAPTPTGRTSTRRS